jgi:hypothetical protein
MAQLQCTTTLLIYTCSPGERKGKEMEREFDDEDKLSKTQEAVREREWNEKGN